MLSNLALSLWPSSPGPTWWGWSRGFYSRTGSKPDLGKMKTLISIDVSLSNLLDSLGERADQDPTGFDIKHDIRSCLQASAVYLSTPPTREELVELVDRAAAVRARAMVYLENRSRIEAEELPPEAQQAIHEAAIGPRDDETLEQCPACRGCPVCKDQRMVTVRVASAWRTL